MIENRLTEVLRYSNLSVRGLAIKCSLKQQTLDKHIKGISEPSVNTLVGIAAAFPEISPEWLLLGVGSMLKSDREDERIKSLIDTNLMTERIKSLIAHMGLSTRAFAFSCGLRQNTLSNQLNGMREVSLSTVMAILNTYPDISTDWLMKGEGDMFKAASINANADRIIKLVDIITTLQDTINAKSDTIAMLNEHIKQLESQLKSK